MGFPHAVKGEGIYAFVTLSEGEGMTPDLQKELKQVIAYGIVQYSVI